MARKFWTVRAAADDPKAGELLLYGPISEVSWWGDEITPKQFHEDLTALGDVTEIKVFINSPGGDVFAGQAIHSMLKRHPANVTVHIDGLAASIASIVAMAGDTVIMPRNAMMMVHNPWTIAMGDAREFRKMADTLDQLRESLIAAYQSKTEMDRTEIIRLLNAETWMTADEAVRMGFADTVEESKKVAAALVRPGVLSMNNLEMDLSKYPNAPDFAALLLRDAADGGRTPTKREIERALRDAGYSQTEAKTILAGRFNVAAETEPEPSRDVPLPNQEARSRTEQARLRSESDRMLARVKREFASTESGRAI